MGSSKGKEEFNNYAAEGPFPVWTLKWKIMQIHQLSSGKQFMTTGEGGGGIYSDFGM